MSHYHRFILLVIDFFQFPYQGNSGDIILNSSKSFAAGVRRVRQSIAQVNLANPGEPRTGVRALLSIGEMVEGLYMAPPLRLEFYKALYNLSHRVMTAEAHAAEQIPHP